jgi:F420-non-reducing hydrogenase iron-sulfur subunit
MDMTSIAHAVDRSSADTMSSKTTPESIVYLCRNCMPDGARLPAQWIEAGMHLHIKEIPCSGKIDAQYLFHALESGMKGVLVITCPQGKCTLAQGNYRAKVRIGTVQRLLKEIGDDPGRADIVHCAEGESLDQIKDRINGAARRFAALASH